MRDEIQMFHAYSEAKIIVVHVEASDVAVPRIRLTIRALMVVVALTAIWLYIITQAIKYQARHPNNHSERGLSE
jgi:hypothetical protein